MLIYRRAMNTLNRRVVHLQGPMFRYKTLKGIADAVFRPNYLLPLMFTVMNNNVDELHDVWHDPKYTYRLSYFLINFISKIPAFQPINKYRIPGYAIIAYASRYIMNT